MKQAWHRRTRHALGHSLRWRLIVVFLLLAGAIAAVFMGSVQKAFSLSWRDAARPMLMDYVDHLAADITPDKTAPPSTERARELTQRLPITVSISGSVVNWQSHPAQTNRERKTEDWKINEWEGDSTWRNLLVRTTSDGHTIEFGLNHNVVEKRPRLVVWALLALLVVTSLAYWYVRRLLRPLDDIRVGAQRFGAGDFAQPIHVRRAHSPDELGQLAQTINTMGSDIQQMLDAKRALLLAISHELRSPLTRARLNTELLPDTPEVQSQRDALLRDLALMRDLVTDLLESERLASPHVKLQREPTRLDELATEVCEALTANSPDDIRIAQEFAANLPTLSLDRARMRLLLRNLLDNALRHHQPSDAGQRVRLSLAVAQEATQNRSVNIQVRDFGPGVPPDALARLAEPFYRPDAARERGTGGVGLGLYLCKLVAQAHGGTIRFRNAEPGLEVTVSLPLEAAAQES